MKQSRIVWSLVVGFATLGLFVWARHRSPSADRAEAPVAKILALINSNSNATNVVAAGGSQATASQNLPAQPKLTRAAALPGAAVAANAAPTALANFAKWAEDYSRASANVVEGQRLAWKRREAMLALIQTDPARALAMAAPFAWRQELPAQVARFLEQQLDGRGDFTVAMGTDFAQGKTTVLRNVQLGGSNYQAFVYGRRLTQTCRSGIPLHGIALDGKLALSSEPLRELTRDEAVALAQRRGQSLEEICGVSGQTADSRRQPVYAESGGGVLCFCGVDHFSFVQHRWVLAESGGTAASGETPPVGGIGGPVNDAWTHGVKTLLFMRLNFPDDLTEPISEGDAYAMMDDVNTFCTTVSYDLAALDTTVSPLVTLPQTKAYYSADPGLLLTDARAATKLAGYDTANYDRDMVAFTSVPNYTFGGLAYVGGKGVWLQSIGAGVAAHELGHNYGLMHANFWDATTNYSMMGPGTNLEYGNPYDTMGAAGAGIYQFDAPHKNQLDWLKSDAVQTVTSNGVYRIYPFDVPASGRVPGRCYAAAVQKDALRYYWLEFRSLFTVNPWNENGLLLNWAPWPESSGGTQLIDTTPGSPDAGDGLSRDDAALVIGRTFNDNAAGVHLTPLQRGSSGTDPWIECQVNLGAFPGNQPPTLSLEVDTTNVAPGTVVHFHAVASDPDGDTLAYAWSFDDLTFSTNNLSWTAKVFSTPGDHVVRCVVSDMKGGEASANAIVTVGGRGGYRVTGQVTDTNGLPLEGVLVGNGLIDPTQFLGGWTDSDGKYVLVNLGATTFNLNAFQFGYTFAPTTWSNPLQPTNDMGGLDFVATPLPMMHLSVDTNLVAETDGSAHYFTVTSTGPTNNDFPVNFVLSGTATLGANYTLDSALTTTNVLIIPAGTNRVTFALHALANALLEGPETVVLTLLDDDLNYGSPNYALAPLATATITLSNPNPPAQPTVTVVAATPEISENGIDLGEFVVTRAGSTQHALVVNYSVGGTASPGTAFVPLAGSVIIPAGQASVTLFLQPVDDHAAEPNSTVVATLLASAGYVLGTPAADTITILDDDVTTVTVFPVSEPAVEPSLPGTFVVKRDGDLTESLLVYYAIGGTAVPGVDYVPLPGSVTIPAGAAVAYVTFTPLADSAFLPDSQVTLTVTNALNYDAGTPDTASMDILQSALPTVSVTAPAAAVSEQGTSFGEFQVSRTTKSGNLTVYLAVSGTAAPGWNYLPLDNSVVIPDGASSVTLSVIPFQDAILDSTLTVELTVLANTNYNVGSPATATLSISDDGTSQTPGIGFCFATSAYSESQSPGIAVGLTYTSAVPVTVGYKVIGGTAAPSRYSLPQGTLTISNNLVGMIPLQIVNDTTVEPPQTVELVLFNPVNATLGAIRVHSYTILDDDLAAVSVTATAPNASETGPVPGNFRIARIGPTNASQWVSFQITGTASAPADYAPLGTSATIPAGAAYVDLPVVPTQDLAPRLPQTVVLTLISATNGAIVAPNIATVTISDSHTNPLPLIVVTSTNQPYAVAGGSNGAFVFTRTGPTNSALTLSFTLGGTAPVTRYAALPSTVTFLAGQSSVALPVVAIDDHQVEGEQTVTLTLSENETYRSAYPSSATVTLQDGDQSVWIDASIFDAAKYGLVPGQFTFSRFGTTNTPVTIFYTISGTASNGLDYVLITNFFVIPAGQLTATLPILPRHNGIVEGPVTAALTLLSNPAYVLGTRTSGTVTIDDDMPMLTVSALVTNVLEGGNSNGVFRITRTGDPKYDFAAYLAVGGTATYGLDYPPFLTNIYFSCGITSIDLFVTPSNNLVADGDHTVGTALLPSPPYTILSPSNAVLTIADAGTNQTPLVLITNPVTYVAFMDGTNAGLVLDATIIDADPTNATLSWTVVSGPPSYVFGNTNAADTTVLFTNAGVYQVRLTANNGVFQGHADILVFVSDEVLPATNILHWSLDEGTGTNVADISGTGRNGFLSGGPAWITNGVINGALQFFGTNDCVRQAAGSNTLNGLNAFTLSLWLKPADIADRGFLTADDADTNATFGLATRISASCGNETNVVEATFATSGGVVHRASASNALTPGQWQHLALTWTNGEEPKLYFNGQLDQPSSGFVAAFGVLTNCPQFILGKGALDTPASWSGAMDDVRVFNVALNADEILALADGPVTNHAPVVDAGTNVLLQLGMPATLVGTVTDDGLPNPPGMVISAWTYLGTNLVTIPNPASLSNTLDLTVPGDYILQLSAFDGQLTSFAEVTVSVIPPTEVDIYADISDAYDMGPVAGDFTLTRTSDTNELTVYLAISGTASNAVDYITLTNAVTFPVGSNSLALPVLPILSYDIKGDQSVIATIVTNSAYYIGNGQATVTIHDSPYGVWSIANFTLEELTQPQISGAGADFSQDGIANFAKYAFNLDPRAVNANPPYTWNFEADTNDSQLHLTLTYTCVLPPRVVQYGVYVSTDLLTWNTGTNYVQDFYRTNNPDGITEIVKTRALMPFPSPTNLFMNIRVWLEQVPGP